MGSVRIYLRQSSASSEGKAHLWSPDWLEQLILFLSWPFLFIVGDMEPFGFYALLFDPFLEPPMH